MRSKLSPGCGLASQRQTHRQHLPMAPPACNERNRQRLLPKHQQQQRQRLNVDPQAPTWHQIGSNMHSLWPREATSIDHPCLHYQTPPPPHSPFRRNILPAANIHIGPQVGQVLVRLRVRGRQHLTPATHRIERVRCAFICSKNLVLEHRKGCIHLQLLWAVVPRHGGRHLGVGPWGGGGESGVELHQLIDASDVERQSRLGWLKVDVVACSVLRVKQARIELYASKFEVGKKMRLREGCLLCWGNLKSGAAGWTARRRSSDGARSPRCFSRKQSKSRVMHI